MTKQTAALEKAKQLFQTGNYSLVAINDEVQWVSNGRGIKPLYQFIMNEPALAKGASVADKVIGKAAALLAVYGGIRAIYTELTTTAAILICENHGIDLVYNKKTDYIENRDHSGFCPMELLAKDVSNPQLMVEKVQHFLEYGKNNGH